MKDFLIYHTMSKAKGLNSSGLISALTGHNGANGDSGAFKDKLRKVVFSFRPEEFIALIAFFPMTYLTLKAYFFFKAQGHVPKLFVGDMQRLGAVVIIIIIAYIISRYRIDHPAWSFLRDVLPFSYCLAIYTNLHDTMHFANPHDIHNTLIAIDQWLFGVQPSVWAQKFIHPWLTEIFSFCYMIFFVFAPLVAAVLLLQKRRREFRETLVTVILCFYAGYLLYVIFPAAPPRIVLKPYYYIAFNGTLFHRFTPRSLCCRLCLPGNTRKRPSG